MASPAEERLERFLQWLQVNRVELRGCNIKYCDSSKGLGIFSASDVSDGVLLVAPLDLAITPMRVLQDPLIGPECRALFEEGEVDDRFLMILFLTVERLRKNSSWKPYIDMLPTTFGNPLWFNQNELLELKGTTLYRASQLQKNTLQSLYENKVKKLVDKLLTLDGDSASEVCFGDFLWANSVFWARALNIPLPHSYVFPKIQEEKESHFLISTIFEASTSKASKKELTNGKDERESKDDRVTDGEVSEETSTSTKSDTIWVEGLVPGIDFCNHDLRAAATWEVDGTGSITGVPFSMYLLSAEQSSFEFEREISISYGNKGNEELLYLYGFVIDDNPDDYLMIHYPVEAIQNVPFSETKTQLLEAQKAEMRCLLPRRLLDQGFFPVNPPKNGGNDVCNITTCNYSWSGERKMPSYLNKLVFPENFLSALRTIAMQEDELFQVSSLLEELVGFGGERQPTDAEVRAAAWEACGDSGALQLLVDLLHAKMMNLEESSGSMDCDTELLKDTKVIDSTDEYTPYEKNASKERDELSQEKVMSRNRWACIVYRRGQKQLASLFLKEAEHALQLSLSEGN